MGELPLRIEIHLDLAGTDQGFHDIDVVEFTQSFAQRLDCFAALLDRSRPEVLQKSQMRPVALHGLSEIVEIVFLAQPRCAFARRFRLVPGGLDASGQKMRAGLSP